MGEVEEVVILTSNAEWVPLWPPASDHVSTEELLRRSGAQPITSVEELVQPGIFDSDEELDEFLTDLYASRRAGLA